MKLSRPLGQCGPCCSIAPLHHVLVCDDLSAFLNPQMYKELIIPIYEKLFAEFPNTQRWLHNDSTTRHIVSQIPKGDSPLGSTVPYFSRWRLPRAAAIRSRSWAV